MVDEQVARGQSAENDSHNDHTVQTQSPKGPDLQFSRYWADVPGAKEGVTRQFKLSRVSFMNHLEV